MNKQTLMALSPPNTRIKREHVAGYSDLYCERGQKSYSFQLKYISPVTGKTRFYGLARFKYNDNINKKMLAGAINKLTLKQADALRGIDPLEEKKSQREAIEAEKNRKTVGHSL